MSSEKRQNREIADVCLFTHEMDENDDVNVYLLTYLLKFRTGESGVSVIRENCTDILLTFCIGSGQPLSGRRAPCIKINSCKMFRHIYVAGVVQRSGPHLDSSNKLFDKCNWTPEMKI